MLSLATLPFATLIPFLVLQSSAPFTSENEDVRPVLPGIPNVRIVHYDVEGRTLAKIRRSIDAIRPTDPNDGTRVDGLSRWDYLWRWHQGSDGVCRATMDDVTFTASITLPRLADARASPKVREEFDRYLQSLLAHEDGHVRYAWEHRSDVVEAINGADCLTAGAAAQAALDAVMAHDVAYDRATDHGSATIPKLR